MMCSAVVTSTHNDMTAKLYLYNVTALWEKRNVL